MSNTFSVFIFGLVFITVLESPFGTVLMYYPFNISADYFFSACIVILIGPHLQCMYSRAPDSLLRAVAPAPLSSTDGGSRSRFGSAGGGVWVVLKIKIIKS